MLLICNGMVRSGSTLQYNLVRSLVEVRGLGEGVGFFSPDQAHSHNLAELASDERFYVLKTHETVSCDLVNDLGVQNFLFFYIYRDLRDVAVSLKNKLNCGGEDLIQRLDHAVALSKAIQCYPNLLSQRYEYVYTNLHGAIAQQAKHIGLKMTTESIDRIAATCSIKNIGKSARRRTSKLNKVARRVFSTIGVKGSEYNRQTLLHSNHISEGEGQVGAWQSALSSAEKSIITERYSSWLAKYSYKL